MENFIVSALKYRPETFETVVGQSSIASTLKNAIRTNHLAHAYLFCGPRGVGKTTCARIFAKTINCSNLTEQYEPCNACESCISFNESRSFNIHELDAASNNSVEDIRLLIDQVRIPPQTGKYSTYIIDEVHMLSSAAFNAFLKTLEEPPSHAIFILATTEKHKIIPTILSRCQIFDFNRIRIVDVIEHLAFIAKTEHIEYEKDAFSIIAQKADGAMRDALSIFDQVVSFSGNKITYKGVIENLNVLDYDYYFQLTDMFLAGNTSQTLLLFNTILEKGFDGHQFINRLSTHFRDLLVCKDSETIKLLETGESIQEKYKTQAVKCPTDFIFEALQICNICDTGYRTSKNQRLHVEITLIRLCNVLNEKKKSEQIIPLNTAASDLHKQSTPTPPIHTHSVNQSSIPTPQAIKEKNTQQVQEHTPYTTVTPSLKNMFNSVKGKNDLTHTLSRNDSPVQPFTEEAFIDAWTSHLATLQQEKPYMFTVLKNIKPKLKDNHTLTITLFDKIQIEEFRDTIKPILIPYMRSALQNYKLDIETILATKQESNDNKPYTAEEKLQYMIHKNPLLGKMKQSLNLDI